jgi:hypothetical protein
MFSGPARRRQECIEYDVYRAAGLTEENFRRSEHGHANIVTVDLATIGQPGCSRSALKT